MLPHFPNIVSVGTSTDIEMPAELQSPMSTKTLKAIETGGQEVDIDTIMVSRSLQKPFKNDGLKYNNGVLTDPRGIPGYEKFQKQTKNFL